MVEAFFSKTNLDDYVSLKPICYASFELTNVFLYLRHIICEKDIAAKRFM